MLVYRLTQIYRLKGAMKFSKLAEAAWHECIRKNNRQRLEHHAQRSIMEQYYNRKLTQIQKVAMLCSVARSNSLVIQPADIHRAMRLLQGLEKTIPIATGTHAVHKDPQLQEIFLRYIPYDWVSVGDILCVMRETDGTTMNWDYNATAAMEYLVKAGCVEDNKGQNGKLKYRRTK